MSGMNLSGISSGGVVEATAYGLGLMPVSPHSCTTANSLAAQLLSASFAVAAVSQSITKLGIWIRGAGVTPGAGINGLAIYSAAGVLLGQTGDMTAAFQVANSYQEAALSGSPVALVAGKGYYLACLANFTGTAPTVAGTITIANTPVIRGNLPDIGITAQAAFPASFNPALNPNNGAFFLTAGP